MKGKNKINRVFYLLFFAFYFLPVTLFSQLKSNVRSKLIFLSNDTLLIDTLSIIPNTLLFSNSGNLLQTNYKVNCFTSQLIFDSTFVEENKNKAFEIQYRVFPSNLTQAYSHKETSIISQPLANRTNRYSQINKRKDSFFDENELKKEGSISRGLSFGNKQDVIVNSNFNLQLSGKLNSEISILASVSENNIPLQAEGNTQQLQEFDKMYIQFFTDKSSLIVGDFELTKPSGYFLNLTKKVKGSQFSHTHKKENQRIKTHFAASVSKGSYSRMKLDGVENNQGPYRLLGAYNELYIVILSGSEKVYINGKLLKRGDAFDYVIDYNKAEIIFNTNTPITKNSRIVFEFEYSERNYARFNLFSVTEFNTEKGDFGLNFYSEADSKTQSINQELSNEEKVFLSEIGNDIDLALVSNVEAVEFQNDIVLYNLIDSLVNGILFHDVYVQSTNLDTANYQLGFSFVGENKGNYRRENSIANGKVFKWIAPENGILQGDYEPVKLLISPKKKQMLSFWGNQNLTKKINSKFELALSNSDLNTYSEIGNEDNKAYAFNLSFNFPSENYFNKIKKQDSIAQKDSIFRKSYTRPRTRWSSSVKYQFVHQDFSELERFKEAEFYRNWNLDDTTGGNENLLSLQVNYFKSDSLSFNYLFDYLKLRGNYEAIKNSINSEIVTQKYGFVFFGSYLKTASSLNNSNFVRYESEITRKYKKTSVGVLHNLEYNIWNKSNNDSLLFNSYYFYEFDFFIRNNTKSKNKWQIDYKFRNDFLPTTFSLTNNSFAQDLNFSLKLLQKKNNSLKMNFNLRKLEVLDSLELNLEPQNSANLRLEYSLRFWKNALMTNLFYENSSGLELRREFSYLEVTKGQGNFIWIDYNSNGIKELDEFELSSFENEGDYIRLLQASNDYEKVFANKFSISVNIKPNRIWKKAEGVRAFLSKFSNQFAYNAGQKTERIDFVPYLYEKENVEEFQNLNLLSRNVFSFNKTNRIFGVDYIFRNNKTVILTSNGRDFSNKESNSFKFRLLIFKSLLISNDFSLGEKSFYSEFMQTRNYTIGFLTNKASLSIQNGRKLKFDFIYSFSEKENIIAYEESSENKFGIKLSYSVAKKSRLNLSADYVKIQFNSDVISPVAYTMLEGLYPGNNVIINVVYQRTISKLLQLNMNYSGRTSDTNAIIHSGNVQIRAVF